MRLPLLTAEDLAVELADIGRALDRTLAVEPVGDRAFIRKWERVLILERWRDALTAQQDET